MSELREAVIELVMQNTHFWCDGFIENRCAAIRRRTPPANASMTEAQYRSTCAFYAEAAMLAECELKIDPQSAAASLVIAALTEARRRYPEWFQAPRRNGRLEDQLIFGLTDALRSGERAADMDSILERVRQQIEVDGDE